MTPLAILGVESSGLKVAVDLLLLAVIVLYLSLIYWTYNDARRRIADPMLVGCSTVASLFPFIGTLVYMVLRPPEYLDDVVERELDLHAAELRMQQLERSRCPHCEFPVENDYLCCPNCKRKLREPCRSCQRPIDPAWTLCPYCATEVKAVVAPPRRRARRTKAAEKPRPAEASPAVAEEPAEDGARPTAAPAGAGRARRPPADA